MNKIIQSLHLLRQIVAYNIKIIFANKFLYFLLTTLIVFITIVSINLFDADWYPDLSEVYSFLLISGLLLIFYPSAFGIQNDLDTRMIEVLFGIPNYRYKVWLTRLFVIYLIVWFMLVLLSILSYWTLVPVPVLELTLQLMFPVAFLGALAFMLSTIIRNGNGTAAVMVILGLIVWISSGFFGTSAWNVFLNPFRMPDTLTNTIWIEILFYNRLYLVIGTILAILTGLYKLQKREKFI